MTLLTTTTTPTSGVVSFWWFHLLLTFNIIIGESHLTLGQNASNCSSLSTEEICFNGQEILNISIEENNQQFRGALFGNSSKGCENRSKPHYTITPTEGVLWIEEDPTDNYSFGIWVKGNLDREEREIYLFNITCEVQTTESLLVKRSLPGILYVIDQNDNPPRTQEGLQRANVSISLHHIHNSYTPHKRLTQEYPKDLVLKDLDTFKVNKYEVVVHDDWKRLFNITINDPIKVKKDTHKLGQLEYTVIMPIINLSGKVEEIQPWKGRYCVNASLINVDLVGNHENPTMDYKICIFWVDEDVEVDYEDENKRRDGGDRLKNSNESATANTLQTYSSVVNSPRGGIVGSCDDACIVFLSTGITIVFFLILGSLYAFKFRNSSKKKGRRIRNLLSGDGQSGDHSGNINGSEMEYIGPGNRNPLEGFRANAHNNTDIDTAAHSTLLNPRNIMLNWQIDSKWEIPRACLTLEEILGVGEFGRVLKGRSHVIPGHEGISIPVAVKMLKDNHEQTGKSCRDEFEAEFSLLKQVDHPNVIKLLGACTTPGGPLYLVMEYAEFGSLRSFLRKCRRVENLQNGNVETEFSGNTLPSTPKDVEQKDYVVSPQEILQFSWQIAKGMTYLSDMKMVHRDLAARNILLTRTKVCKISDFGLTRDIYVDEAYQKKSRDRVPVKWLAPESLADEVYTTKSDVWSFGILLWELATLGASPYPGIASEELYPLLKDGFRMSQPHNCSMELYALMRQCWANDPRNRPTFRTLGISISNLLENGIEYLKLDVPLVSNPGYQYFAPTEEVLQYENQNLRIDCI